LSLSLRSLASQSLSTNPSNLRRSDVVDFISSRNCSLRLRIYVGSYITNKLTDDRTGSFIHYMFCVTPWKILHKISCKNKAQKGSIQSSQMKFQYVLTCQLNQRLGIIHRPINAQKKKKKQQQFMTSIKLPHVLALGGRSLIFAMKCGLLGAFVG